MGIARLHLLKARLRTEKNIPRAHLIERKSLAVHVIKTAAYARGKCCSGHFFKSVTYAVEAFQKQQVVCKPLWN